MHDSLHASFLNELGRQSALASGRTAPNPTVAALVYHSSNPHDFAVGATEPPGGRHAEIVALDRWKSNHSGPPDTMAVTLEPCSRTGRTPPCVDRILSIPELQTIYIGGLDPSLGGEGAQRLRDAGRQVLFASSGADSGEGGANLKPEIALSVRAKHPEDAVAIRAFLLGLSQIFEAFVRPFCQRLDGRPRLILKAATDSKSVMGSGRSRLLLSAKEGRAIGQLLRRSVDAVLVGPGTILTDWPSLDFRSEELFALALRESSAAPDYSLAPDPWMEFLLSASASPDLETSFSHQPDRVFLAPKSEKLSLEWNAWKEKQSLLEGRTGAKSIFWEVDRASLQTEFIAQTLLPELARSYNTVMIEGGAGLFRSLQNVLLSTDRFYWLRGASELGGVDDPVILPEFLQLAPVLQTWDFAHESLSSMRPGGS